nr:hypothetical protein [Tanacetum cinerariifolium]
MSTQQDIYVVGSESRPPILNKEKYVPWSSRLFRYAKSRPNGKIIHNSILNGPYVRRMIPEPGDANREVTITITETFHLQTDDELSNKKLNQIEADDQAIQTILLGLPEDIYATEKKAKLFNEWERFTSNEGESIESYYHHFLKLLNDLKRNKYFPKKIASNLKSLNNLQPEWSRHVTIVHQSKNFHTADYTQLYDFLKYNQNENAVQNSRVQNDGNQIGLIGVQGNGNQNQIENDGSAEVHENYDGNEIFNMFTQEEQYTELLKPIPESHQVPQNDNDVISEDTSVEQGGEIVEQHPANFEETCALYDSLYQNLETEVERVNS